MRRLVLVVGSDDSATGSASTILEGLGLLAPDAVTGWARAFHERLLDEAAVEVGDARPAAWFETGRVALAEDVRTEASEWLEAQFAVADELVLSDPGLVWFTTLWESAAIRAGAVVGFVTVLDAPPGRRESLAGWVNRMLHAERATRGSLRHFVRHAGLVEDWTGSVMAIGTQLDLAAVRTASAKRINKVNRLVDELPEAAPSAPEEAAPPVLRELAASVADSVDALVTGESDTACAALDAVADRYLAYYRDCETVARSSGVAASRSARAAVERKKQERIDQLQQRISDLKTKVTKAERRSVRLRERNAQLRGRLASSQERVAALRAERKECRAELRALRQEVNARPPRLRDRVVRRVRGSRRSADQESGTEQ